MKINEGVEGRRRSEVVRQGLGCLFTAILFVVLPVCCKDFNWLLLKAPKQSGEGNAVYAHLVMHL